MEKKRNGLIEIYRFILCFWPLYYHNFFFTSKGESFSVAELAVDFFFVLSGFFLLRAFEKKKGSVIKSTLSLMYGRVKPFMFSLCFIAAFNAVCVSLFIRENHLNVLFELFKYWWYVLYLTVAIGVFYLFFRLLRNRKVFFVFLLLVSATMGLFHYYTEVRGLFLYELTFVARTFGCMAFGMLVSYIPTIKKRKHNLSILGVIALVPAIFHLAYSEKNYVTCLIMIGLFAALVYFTYNVSIGGKFFDVLGRLSTRIYLYMAFITMLYILGLTDHRILFIVDVSLAIMDLILTHYREKYLALKAKLEK